MVEAAEVTVRVSRILRGIDPSAEVVDHIAQAICHEPRQEDPEIHVPILPVPPGSPSDPID